MKAAWFESFGSAADTLVLGEQARPSAGPGEVLVKLATTGVNPSDVPHGSEDTNDQHDLQYRYLSGKTSGTLSFDAPEQPGSYDIRLHDTDGGGTEIASVTFTVR